MSRLHPELTPDERRALVLAGVELFRDGRYFEAHEAFEEVWRSTMPAPRDLFQGLVQVAAALHHFQRHGRIESARRLLARARLRLAPLPSPCLGLDLSTLLADTGRFEAWLAAPAGEPPPLPSLAIDDPDAVR